MVIVSDSDDKSSDCVGKAMSDDDPFVVRSLSFVK